MAPWAQGGMRRLEMVLIEKFQKTWADAAHSRVADATSSDALAAYQFQLNLSSLVSASALQRFTSIEQKLCLSSNIDSVF